MKKILLILSITIATNSIAQKQKDTLIALPSKDGKVFYDRIYQDSGFSKNDLYVKAKNAFLRLFPATKDVIQNEDKEDGIISAKGIFTFYEKGGLLNQTWGVDMKATFNIIVKDGKYKIEIFDFYRDEAPDSPDPPRSIENLYLAVKHKNKPKLFPFYSDFNTRVLQIFDQINDEMNKKLSTDF